MQPEIKNTSGGESAATADAILCTALDVGQGLLRCGGEIQRVEDTITRICQAFGAAHVEVFTITSLILASVRMPDGSYSSQTRRILRSGYNLYRLSRFNEISRRICGGVINLEQAQREIYEVKRAQPYPPVVNYLGAVLGAGGFTVFFGGSLRDAAAAALIGILMIFIDRHKPDFINSMAISVIISLIAGTLAMLSVKIGFAEGVDKVMIGTIMLVIPGLAVSTAVRDMMCGDTITGSTRMAQSILLAIMIALSYGATILMFGGAL